MDNLKWHFAAKIVGLIDLILSFLLIISLPVGISLISWDKVISWDEWLMLLFHVISVAVNFWASVMLIKATESETKANEALRLSQFWQRICLVSIVSDAIWFTILLYRYSKQMVWSKLAVILIRGICFDIVTCFTLELKTVIGGTPI